MADEKKQPIKYTPSLEGIQSESFSQNQPLLGMVSDLNINVEGLNPNEYSFALNARLNAYSRNGLTSGEVGAIMTDMGNIDIAILPDNYDLIQSVHLKGTNNEFCLFLYNPITKHSQIGILDVNKTYTIYIDTTCLQFDNIHSIKSISTLYKSSDRLIFWTDNYNKPKYINLDDLQAFKDNLGNWLCDSFNVQRSVDTMPNISLQGINRYGGSLKYGTYQFYIRYLTSNNNYTNWINFSNPIPIVNNKLSSYDNITGTYNAANDLDLYGLQESNNTIILDINNLDKNNFKYFQLGVLEYIKGVGVSSNAYILKKQPITNNTAIYSYSGNSTLIDSITTENEFVIPSVKIDKAASIETIGNRIIYANTSNKRYDWGKFQQAVNNANVNYIVTKVKANSLDDLSTKNPKHYDISRSLMRDEVEALGVVFYLKDTVTPVFHLAGRIKDSVTVSYGNTNNLANTGNEWNTPQATNAWDSEIISNTDSLSFGNNAERWQVYNTAIKNNSLVGQFTSNNEEIVASGILGYYECSNVYYPDTKDEDGNLIYPNTNGVMHNVRHHRMPDTNLEIHCEYDSVNDEQFIYPLGLVLSNLIIPTQYVNEITGYALVIANKKDKGDYTVVDKALMTAPFVSKLNEKVNWWSAKKLNKGAYLTHSVPFTLGNGFKTTVNTTDNSLSVMAQYQVGIDAPQSKFNKQALNCDYLKLEGLLNTGGQGLEYLSKDKKYYLANAELHRFARFPLNYTGFLNYKCLNTAFVNYNLSTNKLNVGTSFQTELRGFQGYGQSAMFAQLELESPMYNINNRYGHVGDEGYLAENFNIYGYYVALKNNIIDLHSNLQALTYRRFSNIQLANNTSVDGFNGDSFITKWDIRRSIQNPNKDEYVWKMTDLDNATSNIDKSLHAYISTNMSIYIESRINTEYRNIGANDYETFYSVNKNVLNTSGHIDGNLTIEDIENYVLQEDYQDYNVDYNVLNNSFVYFPISDNYESRYYTNDLKYRVWYSEHYINGDNIDGRFKILANNYTELDIDNADTYGITDVFSHNGNLYVHTSKTMFALQVNPQQLQTNENTIFVGQGDFLALPPKAFSSVHYGYAGSSHFSHKCISEQGVLFIDSNRNKIFLFNEKFDELNNKKQNSFFNYNIALGFVKSWHDKVNVNYIYLNSSQSKYYIGYKVFYDKLYNRLFVSKRDFEFNVIFNGLLSDIDISNTFYSNALFYDDILNNFVLVTNYDDTRYDKEIVDFTNKDIFVNKSFTMSYSLETGMWISYHSFNPNNILEDGISFYTYITDNSKIWYHGDIYKNTTIKPCSYYDTKYPHIIEFTVINDKKDTINQHTLNYINYISSASYNNLNVDRLVNKTFNQFYIYNSYQHSGLLKLKIYDKKVNSYNSIKVNTDTALVYNENINSWNINGFRDIAIENNDLDNHTTDWSELNSYYNGTQGFIDKLPTNINYNKNVYERRRFTDRFARIRLIYDYNLDETSNLYDNMRLTTNIVLTNMSNTKLK